IADEQPKPAAHRMHVALHVRRRRDLERVEVPEQSPRFERAHVVRGLGECDVGDRPRSGDESIDLVARHAAPIISAQPPSLFPARCGLFGVRSCASPPLASTLIPPTSTFTVRSPPRVFVVLPAPKLGGATIWSTARDGLSFCATPIAKPSAVKLPRPSNTVD